MVRAKFKVISITRTEHWDRTKGELHTIELQPVTGGSEENNSFFAATPSGVIKLGTLNADAAQAFSLGAEMYVGFTPALEPVAAGD